MAIYFGCAEDKSSHSLETLSTDIFEGRTTGYSEHRNLYFGDLHIHTGWSFDAFVSEVRVTPDEAYLFGKGESIQHVSGKQIQMKRPLDFMAVSDHAEYMGALMQMSEVNSPLYDLQIARDIRSPDKSIVGKAMKRLQFSIATNRPNKSLIQKEDLQYTWRKMVQIADRHYDPGTFTTFPAYEWTSSPAVWKSLVFGPRYARNLHRNVIYKGGKVSSIPFSSFDSQNPEKLWEWMESQRQEGIELLAIPHNANISEGRMYALNTYEGGKMNRKYIETRARNEPVNEVVQIKGQSMVHPILSPDDEFADFEIYQYALGQSDPRKEVAPQGGFVREALKDGLAIEKKQGYNPFEFGVIGSSDSHNGGPNVEEDNNIGKSGKKDHTPEVRLSDEPAGTRNRRSSVGGLAAVWAKENTRESIYEALERKEVYATSGPRMEVRFFASRDWGDLNFAQKGWDSIAYDLGVPMGAELTNLDSNPSFLIYAIKDPDGANLDRVQVIKGWVDDEGQKNEKIYDVVWSEERTLNGREELPSVGNTVDSSSATYTNDIGAVMLQTFWTDPDFNPTLSSFYYLRVLEIPTPRWTTYDAAAINRDLPQDVPYYIQERAWSSPIWYYPE